MSMNDVVCIGSAAMDDVVLLEEVPSPDQIVVAKWWKQFCGGSSANVAVAGSRLGLHTGLISKVGQDPAGRTLLDRLSLEEVDLRAVKISGKTARTIVLLTRGGEKMIVAEAECILKSERELPNSYLKKTKALYIGECYISVAEKAVNTAQKSKITSVLRLKNVHISPGLNLEPVICKADFVIMNEKTYSKIRCSQAEKEYDNFIITRGKKGCRYLKEDITVQGFPVKPVDSTGAGDAFCAAFMYQILKRSNIERALRFAVAAGGVATTRYGAMNSMPSEKEIELLLQRE